MSRHAIYISGSCVCVCSRSDSGTHDFTIHYILSHFALYTSIARYLNNLNWSYQLFNRFILTAQWKNDALSIGRGLVWPVSAISLNIAYIDINRRISLIRNQLRALAVLKQSACRLFAFLLEVVSYRYLYTVI